MYGIISFLLLRCESRNIEKFRKYLGYNLQPIWLIITGIDIDVPTDENIWNKTYLIFGLVRFAFIRNFTTLIIIYHLYIYIIYVYSYIWLYGMCLIVIEIVTKWRQRIIIQTNDIKK